MYAIINDGGKQYKVSPGDVLEIERREVASGDEIVFDKVALFYDDKKVKVGNPTLSDTKVTAEVVGENKGKKIVIFKFKRRKKYRKKIGHRQKYTQIKIKEIKT